MTDARPPSALLQLTLTRMRMFFRDPSSVFWTFGFPLLLSLALGTAFRNRPPDPVVVAVADGEGADAIRQTLSSAPNVRLKQFDQSALDRALASGKVALVVEPGGATTGSSQGARHYRFDPTRPESRLARLVVDDLLQRASGRQDAVPVSDVAVTAPGARYIDFLVPGLIGMNIMSNGMWGVGHVLVDFRTRRLLKRLSATPMRRREFLLSFVLVRMGFLALELPVFLVFARYVFGVSILGSLPLFLGVATLGSFAFAGLGLLVAARAKNTQTSVGLINLMSLPMYVFSGVFFASTNFPEAVQPFIRWLPLTALIDAMRAIMNEGVGVSSVLPQLIALTVCAALSFAIALRIFRWR